MNTKQIKIALTVRECGSLSEAGRKLYISTAAVSRNINTLEAEIGITIFDRDNYVVKPTQPGELFLDHTEQALSIIDQGIVSAQALQRGAYGSLSICVLDGQMLDPRTHTALMNFKKKHPDVKLLLQRCNTHEALQRLEEGDADLFLTACLSEQKWGNLNKFIVSNMDTKLVVPRTHRLADKANLRLSDFSDETFVMCSHENESYHTKVLRNIMKHEVNVIVAPDIETQALLVETECGVAFSNEYHAMCTSPTLRGLALSDAPSCQCIFLWRQQNTNPLVVMLLDEFSSY